MKLANLNRGFKKSSIGVLFTHSSPSKEPIEIGYLAKIG